MSQIAHPTIATPHHDLDGRVQTLEQWRKLTVDPQLEEHGRKLESFERIEQQITGIVRFFRIAGSVVAAAATITEVTRFILTLAHLAH